MKYELPEYELNYERNKFDVNKLLSPEMAKVIKYQLENADGAFDTNVSWEEMRKNYIEERKFWNQDGPKSEKVVEIEIDGPEGKIPLRLYYPNSKEINSSIVYIHGGGFVVGNNDTHDRIMRKLMHETDSVVVGVDYRLAPEYKFPTQLFEVVASIEYIHNNGKELGIDQDDISIAGDSGGGNLALAANLFIRDNSNNDYIKSLMLYYPLLGLKDSRSMRLYGWELDGMRKEDLESYDNLYMAREEDKINPYYQLINSDLTYGIPQTYLSCGSLDPLLDDSILLQEILNYNNIKCELDVVEGALHAFMHYSLFMEDANDIFKKSGEFYKNR